MVVAFTLKMNIVNCGCGSTIRLSSLRGHLKTKKHIKYINDAKAAALLLPKPDAGLAAALLLPKPDAGLGLLHNVDVNILNSVVFRLPSRAIKNMYQTSVHCSNVVKDYTGCMNHKRLYRSQIDLNCYSDRVKKYIACTCAYAIAVGGMKFRALSYLENIDCVVKLQPDPPDTYGTTCVGDDGMNYYFSRSSLGNSIVCLPLWTFDKIDDLYRFMANNGFASSPSQAVSDALSNILQVSIVNELSIPFGDYLPYK